MVSTYSTWEFYNNTYHGTVAQNLYEKYALQVTHEINRQTFGNAQNAPSSMQEALCLCECELVDAFARFEESFNLLPKGISSMNNDGFSLATSYGSSQTDSRESAQNLEVRSICQKYLLRPINLLYAGV